PRRADGGPGVRDRPGRRLLPGRRRRWRRHEPRAGHFGCRGGGELKLGYRPIAPLAFGVFGTCSRQANGDMVTMSSTTSTATAGIFADWHFRPGRSMDPWLGLSTGWRGLWIVPDTGKNTSLQGLEVAHLQVGLDYRITPEIAIAPVIGASMAIF